MSAMLGAAAGAIAAAWVTRRLRDLRVEREVAERLPTGASGIIAGAESIVLEGSAESAVLLLHGFGDTPHTLRHLAKALHAAGHTVRAPLLPGHGRTLREFARSGADEWRDAALGEARRLRRSHERFGIVGVSMGGALAVRGACAEGGADALVLIAPYLEMPPRLRRAARASRLAGFATGYVRSASPRSIHDPVERAQSRGFGVVTLPLLRELEDVIARARALLPAVQAPSLILQSREDNRVTADGTERAYARLGSATKRLVWMDQGGHILTVDTGRERVQALTTEWLAAHMQPPATRTVR